MVRDNLPEKLWEYGYRWMAETMSLTLSSDIGLYNIPICKVI